MHFVHRTEEIHFECPGLNLLAIQTLVQALGTTAVSRGLRGAQLVANQGGSLRCGDLQGRLGNQFLAK